MERELIALLGEGQLKENGSVISVGLCPNLFTLCTLQAFAVCDYATNFLRDLATFAVLVPQCLFAGQAAGST